MESNNVWPCVPTDGFEMMMIQCHQKQIVIFLHFVLKVGIEPHENIAYVYKIE